MRPELHVMIVAPHDVERAGLRLIIEQETVNRVVAEAAEGSSALALARAHEPDVAVVDSSLPDVPALGLAHFLTRYCPRTEVLLYTEKFSRGWVVAALREGVRAFVLKSKVGVHLLPALRALADHRPYWDEAVPDELPDELLESGPRPRPVSLTSREWQVLEMVSAGRSSKEMARAIGVSPKTIETFRSSLRRKLGFRNMADLTRYVSQRHPRAV